MFLLQVEVTRHSFLRKIPRISLVIWKIIPETSYLTVGVGLQKCPLRLETSPPLPKPVLPEPPLIQTTLPFHHIQDTGVNQASWFFKSEWKWSRSVMSDFLQPSVHGFSRQEYYSGLPFSKTGFLMEPASAWTHHGHIGFIPRRAGSA